MAPPRRSDPALVGPGPSHRERNVTSIRPIAIADKASTYPGQRGTSAPATPARSPAPGESPSRGASPGSIPHIAPWNAMRTSHVTYPAARVGPRTW